MESDRPVEYPKVGDQVQLIVGKQGDVKYLAIYDVKNGNGKNKMTLEFIDIRVVKESDIPI